MEAAACRMFNRFGTFALVPRAHWLIWRRTKEAPQPRGSQVLASQPQRQTWEFKTGAVLVAIAPPMARSQPIFRSADALKAGPLCRSFCAVTPPTRLPHAPHNRIGAQNHLCRSLKFPINAAIIETH